jgi:DMSO/TMAO reductase YedYZ heme-binding membrane subunit
MGLIIFCIFLTITPFLALFSQVSMVGNFTYAFGNISGFIGAVLLLWEFILGIKEITKKIDPAPGSLLKLHIFLGVWGMFFVLIHPILEMFSYGEKITFLFFPDISTANVFYITLGRVALLLVLLLWITSTFIRKNITHKVWLFTHYLSYPLMFFVFVHALFIGSFINAFFIIKIYWFFLLTFYLGLAIWRITLLFPKKIKNYTPLQNEYYKK